MELTLEMSSKLVAMIEDDVYDFETPATVDVAAELANPNIKFIGIDD
jgi:hypothetical protein